MNFYLFFLFGLSAVLAALARVLAPMLMSERVDVFSKYFYTVSAITVTILVYYFVAANILSKFFGAEVG